MLRPLEILLVKNGKIMENTTTSKKQTAQVRLDELIEVLNTTDPIHCKRNCENQWLRHITTQNQEFLLSELVVEIR